MIHMYVAIQKLMLHILMIICAWWYWQFIDGTVVLLQYHNYVIGIMKNVHI